MATNAQEQPDSPPPSDDIPPRGTKPFSREDLLEEMRKNPRPFVPGAVPRMHIPREEAEEFIRVIHEARDVP